MERTIDDELETFDDNDVEKTTTFDEENFEKFINIEMPEKNYDLESIGNRDLAQVKILPMAAQCCSVCSKQFSKNWILKRHISEVHYKLKEYECSDCDATFSQKQALDKHIKTVHQGAKNFKCIYCDKWYSQPGNLKYHIESFHKKRSRLFVMFAKRIFLLREPIKTMLLQCTVQ